MILCYNQLCRRAGRVAVRPLPTLERKGEADMKQGYIFIAIATIMFSTFEVALKYIAGEINSVQLTFARFFIGFLFLAPLAWRTLKKRGLYLEIGRAHV